MSTMEVIEISSDEDHDGEKKGYRTKEDDDCCVLSHNPFLDEGQLDPLLRRRRRLSVDADLPSPPPNDVVIVAEQGQVACRDYPHSRHLCATYPFDKTLHRRHCRKCYCYVCDKRAPCKFWTGHCHASDRSKHWMSRRESVRSKASRQSCKSKS